MLSMEHLNPPKSSKTPNIITSIARYHLYYTIRRFMKRPSRIDPYDVSLGKKGIPLKYAYHITIKLDSRGEPVFIDGYKEYSSNDYLNFIAKES